MTLSAAVSLFVVRELVARNGRAGHRDYLGRRWGVKTTADRLKTRPVVKLDRQSRFYYQESYIEQMRNGFSNSSFSDGEGVS